MLLFTFRVSSWYSYYTYSYIYIYAHVFMLPRDHADVWYIHIHLIAPTFSYDIYHKHPKVYIKLLAETRWNCKFWFNFHFTWGLVLRNPTKKKHTLSLPKSSKKQGVLMYQPYPDNGQALALSEGFRQRMLENNIQMYNSMLRPWECQTNGVVGGEKKRWFWRAIWTIAKGVS